MQRFQSTNCIVSQSVESGFASCGIQRSIKQQCLNALLELLSSFLDVDIIA